MEFVDYAHILSIWGFMEKVKDIFNTCQSFLRRFAYSDFYFAWISLIVFVGWVSRSAVFGFVSIILTAILLLLTLDDILPLIVCIFNAVLMIFTNDINVLLPMWPTFIPLGLAIIVFTVRNFNNKFSYGKLAFECDYSGYMTKMPVGKKILWTLRHYNKAYGLGAMFLPQLFVSIVLLIGGVGVISQENYMLGLPTGLALGFGVLIVYMLCNHYLKRDSKRDTALYFAKMMMYIGLVIILEMIVYIAKNNLTIDMFTTDGFDLGWGNRNNVATYLVMTMPMCFYLSTRYRRGFVAFAIGILQMMFIFISMSRGAIIAGSLAFFMSLVLVGVKVPKKRQAFIQIGATVILIAIALIIFKDKVTDVVQSVIDRGMDSAGRELLYKEAIALFKQYTLLGVGLGYSGDNFNINVMSFYWFHSTLFQVIANMGIVGLVVYVFYYFIRLKQVFINIKHTFNLFILAMWGGFEGYSLIDVGTFSPYPNMMLIIISCLMLELPSSRKEGYIDEYNCQLTHNKNLAKMQRWSKDFGEYIREL